MEAARYITAIESKDILDYLVKNSNNFDHTRFCIPMIQICSKYLYLKKNGIYYCEHKRILILFRQSM